MSDDNGVYKAKTLEQYILLIEDLWPRVVKTPVRFDDVLGGSPGFNDWSALSASQQVSVMKFVGTTDERHGPGVGEVLAAKPESVTWQNMLDTCFEREIRQPLTEIRDKRNNKDK